MKIHDALCPNCFRKNPPDQACPFCGYRRKEKSPLALPLNVVLRERYVAGHELGSGGFGITYKGYDLKTERVCAIKEYVPVDMASRLGDSLAIVPTGSDKREAFAHGRQRFLREADTLRQLTDISDIVDIWDCFEENGTAYFVMEFVNGQNLNRISYNAGGHLPYEMASEVIVRVAQTMDVVHRECGIFHRDLTPENIMITKDAAVKIIDFGIAKYLPGEKSQSLSVMLKKGYAPPEQYYTSGKQGTFTDVYALAATFYKLLTGTKIEEATERLVRDKESQGIVPLESYPFLGEPFRKLTAILNRALRTNYRERTQTLGIFAAELLRFDQAYKKAVPADRRPTAKEPVPTRSLKKKVSQKQKGLAVHSYPYLEIVSEGGRGSRYYLPVAKMVTIGHAPSCNIEIASRVVSRQHVEIFYDPYERLFYFQDSHSKNHTYLNGTLCDPSEIYPGKPGDLLALAGNACVFQLGVIDAYDKG